MRKQKLVYDKYPRRGILAPKRCGKENNQNFCEIFKTRFFGGRRVKTSSVGRGGERGGEVLLFMWEECVMERIIFV